MGTGPPTIESEDLRDLHREFRCEVATVNKFDSASSCQKLGGGNMILRTVLQIKV